MKWPNKDLSDCGCGKRPQVICLYSEAGPVAGAYRAECECGLQTPVRSFESHVVTAWNSGDTKRPQGGDDAD